MNTQHSWLQEDFIPFDDGGFEDDFAGNEEDDSSYSSSDNSLDFISL